MKTKNLYLIIGKSGAGKTTVSNTVAKRMDLKAVPSYTTRPARYDGELGHIFVSKEKFDTMKMIAYTMFNGYEYGVTEDLLDQYQLYVIDPYGVRTLRENYHHRPIKTVFLDVSNDSLRSRMELRGDSAEAIKSRLENDNIMFPAEDIATYDCIIDANADVESVAEKLENYILQCETIKK